MKGNSNENILPPGWKWVKLGEYVTSVKGKKPKRISKEKTFECSIPYVNIKAFEKKEIDEYTDGIGCVLCGDGDFLMVWDGSRSGFVGKGIKGALGSTLVKLNFPVIENNYAFYFLQSKFIEINTRAKGVGIPHVDPNILWNYRLLIPPIETQRTIVSKIEELFSELDKGIENLKTAQQQLKTYRQSVLKWAFEGKLTREEGRSPNYELRNTNYELPLAAEPKENYLTDLPEGWRWVTLGEICDPARKCSYGVLVPGENVEDGIKLLRVGDINENGIINHIDMKKISPLIASKYKRTFLQGGEVVISLVGAIGRTAVIPVSLKGANTARAVGVIPVSKNISAKFVEMMLRSPKKIREHNKSSHEVARKTLNLEDVVRSKIPLPPFKEQLNIVQTIETRLSVADKMEESINLSLQKAEALRLSILKRAFEGRLVSPVER